MNTRITCAASVGSQVLSPLPPPPHLSHTCPALLSPFAQVGDIYPEHTQLKKGEFTVKLMLRHDSQEVLDKLTGLPLVRMAGELGQ